jgi:hypothetical protein
LETTLLSASLHPRPNPSDVRHNRRPFRPTEAPVDPLAIFRRHTSVLLSSQRSLFAGANFHAHLRHSSGAPSFPRNFHVDNLRKCLTRAGFDASLYAGHSFRRGMATWAELSARMDDGDIKIPGCWISDAVSVKLYQETTTSHVAHMAQMTLRPRAPSRTVLSPPPMLVGRRVTANPRLRRRPLCSPGLAAGEPL